MPRKSKYFNNDSIQSNQIITDSRKKELPQLQDIEDFQLRYGVSDSDFALMIGVDRSWISQLKSGSRDLPLYVSICMQLAMEDFKRKFV